jgi:DNA (cytosine-5)-methyltransferase 1
MSTPQAWPTAVDLFAGCGGLSLGLKQAGFRVLAAVELDALAVATYTSNHRKTKVFCSDIRRLPAKNLLKSLSINPGELDLLAGCPPCQSFSSVRSLNGKRRATGAGSNMIYEFLRFVRVLQPKTVMLENVPALAKNWRFAAARRTLTSLGYSVVSGVMDAADYDTPQRRRRLILMGSKLGKPALALPLATKRTVRTAIGHLAKAGTSGDPCHDFPEKRSTKVSEIIRLIPRNGGGRRSLSSEFQLACHRGLVGFNDVYGRMAWDQVSPTITGGCVNPSKGRFLHPEEDRAITLREAALLQGFPGNYKFSLARGKFKTAEMIGNAFPPPFVASHARVLRVQLRASGWKRRGRRAV